MAIAIKIEDRGPVFFVQKRVTRDGEVFGLLKLRSMIVGAEKQGVRPTVEGDARITKVGSFIRPTRIDELPQLFNILSGKMSIVGPRPERVEHVRRYSEAIPEFVFREKVKAGLTGYAQIYGRYNTTAYAKIRGLYGHADDGQARLRGDDARKMRGLACKGDYHPEAV